MRVRRPPGRRGDRPAVEALGPHHRVRATGRSGSRSATRATANASAGSDLPRCLPLRRAVAISLVGTRTTASPAPSRSRSRRRVTCRQSSRAKRRSGQRAAHSSVARCPSGVTETVHSSSSRPTSSTATSVWVRLCASTPTTTMVPASLICSWGCGGPIGGHAFGEVVARLLASYPGRSVALDGRRMRDKHRHRDGQRRTSQPARPHDGDMKGEMIGTIRTAVRVVVANGVCRFASPVGRVPRRQRAVSGGRRRPARRDGRLPQRGVPCSRVAARSSAGSRSGRRRRLERAA